MARMPPAKVKMLSFIPFELCKLLNNNYAIIILQQLYPREFQHIGRPAQKTLCLGLEDLRIYRALFISIWIIGDGGLAVADTTAWLWFFFRFLSIRWWLHFKQRFSSEIVLVDVPHQILHSLHTGSPGWVTHLGPAAQLLSEVVAKWNHDCVCEHISAFLSYVDPWRF